MAGGGYSLGKAIGSDIPLEHLDSSYIETCKNAEELEKIIKILRFVLWSVLQWSII